jgi:endoglucanase
MTNPFIHAKGQRLVDGQGRDIRLRGIGLGGWLLPEGYMWKFPQEGDRPRRIEAYFERCLGATQARAFWSSYTHHFITLADLQAIKRDGFNSIRIPLHWRFVMNADRTFNDAHWSILDQVIAWCEQERLYVILDLHGAPGGQTGTNIDDSANDHPDLFTSTAYQDLTVFLWESLAHRYKDREIIACYDLLNEPLPNWFSAYHPQLVELYQRLIRAIRAIDPHHMISLEGAHWATDWSIFEKPWDDNVLYQFHKYWNNPDQASLKPYLDFRDRWNVPIFMGEGGENNPDWYIGAFTLLEEHHISWNFWTYKKMETTNSPYSIPMPKDWHVLAQAIASGDLLEASLLEEILASYVTNIQIDHCDDHPEVAHAIFRRIPISYPVIFYNQNSTISHGLQRPNVGFRREDHSEIRFVDSQRTSPNFSHGQGQAWANDDRMEVVGQPGDVYRYIVWASQDQRSPLHLLVKAERSTTLSVSVGDHTVTLQVFDTNRKTISVGSFHFREGVNAVEVTIRSGQVALERWAIDGR